MKHKLDYPTIPVGQISDWYATDEKGNLLKDVKGKPYQDDNKWKAARRTANGHQPDGLCIGGSAAAAIAGIFPGKDDGCMENAFKSKYDLYCELKGIKRTIPEADKSDIYRIGHQYEEAVAEEAAGYLNETFFAPKGLHCIYVNDTRMFLCGVKNEDNSLRFPHAIADLDRILLVYDEKETLVGSYGLEIKTTREFKEKWTVTKENPLGVPEQYQVQTHHYMGVCNINGFFIACKSYRLDEDIVVRYVPRDVDLEERILMNEEKFIQEVIAGNIPEVDNEVPEKRSSAEASYWKKPFDGEKLSLPEESLDIVEEYEIANASYNKLVKEMAEMKEKLQSALSYRISVENKFLKYFRGTERACGTVSLPDGSFCTVWCDTKKKRAGKGIFHSYDLERMKTENPDLFKRVTTTEEVTKMLPKSKIKKNDKVDIEAFASTIPYLDEYGNPMMECSVTFFDPKETKK